MKDYFYKLKKQTHLLFRKRISLKQSIYVAKRISFLLEAGVSVPAAFLLVGKQLKKRGRLLESVAKSISHGQTITETISNSNIFGPMAMPLIGIGEESGTLADSFSALSEELEKRSQLKQKIIGAIIYPACILVGMLILVIVLMTVVFPKMLGVFSSLNVELPTSTKLLMLSSTFLREYGIVSFIFVIFSAFLIIILHKKYEKFHIGFDRLCLRLPLISSMVRSYILASTSNIIGLLLINNTNLLSAIYVCGKTCSNFYYREIFKEVYNSISNGVLVGDAFKKYLECFPSEFIDLISIGEQTGKLAESFSYTHTIYARDLDSITKSLSSSIEPVLMIIIGLTIGLIALSVVSPMYGITSHLHG